MDLRGRVLALTAMELRRHVGDHGFALDGKQAFAVALLAFLGSAHGGDVERDAEAAREGYRRRGRVACRVVSGGGEQQSQAAVAVRQPAAVAGGKDTGLAVAANLRIERPVEGLGGFRLHREETAFADLVHVIALAQEAIGFVLHPVEIQPATEALAPSCFLGEHFRAGDVDEIHSQRDDQYRPLPRVVGIDLLQGILDMVDGAEIGRAIDPHDAQLRAFRLAARVDEVVAAGIIDRHQRLDAGSGGAIQIEQQRQQHPGDDAGLEVEQGAEDGDPEDGRLLPAGVPDRADVMEIDQTPGDQEQDAGHRRMGQVGRQRRDREQDQDQEHRGENRRQRRARAGFVIHARAVEGTRRGVSGKEGAGDVRQPLADEFLVAVDALLRAHGDRAGNRDSLGQGQHGDHQRRAEGLLQRGKREVRQRQRRQTGRQRTDRADAGRGLAHQLVEGEGDQAADQHRGDHVGKLLPPAARGHAGRQRRQANGRDPRIDAVELECELVQDFVEGQAARDLDAEEGADLARCDQHRGTGGEADHHGMRNEIHQRAHARQAQRHLENADLQRQGEDQPDILRCARFGQVVDGGVNGDRDRRGRSRHQVPRGAEQRGDYRRDHRRIQAILRRQAGDGGKGHALRQHDECAGQAGEQVLAQRLPCDQRPPAQEGKQFGEEAGRQFHRLRRGGIGGRPRQDRGHEY